jgi:GNAT superfamily N-acetyltransferase
MNRGMSAATQMRGSGRARDRATEGWRIALGAPIVAPMFAHTGHADRASAPPDRLRHELVVRAARGAELVAGCALAARALDFDDRDALAPWLVQTAAACGGLALGAFSGDALVGFCFALPAAADELFCCALAVDPAWRERGVGRRLMLAQREQALARGCVRIRWTADPLSAPALALYLSGLGARMVAYEPELYATVRPAPVPPDDVVIEWTLGAVRPPGAPAARIEIPYDRPALDRDALRRWRLDVRTRMLAAFGAGGVGTGVVADRAARRAWVLFASSS